MLAGYPLADPVVGLLITAAIMVVLRTAARDVFRRLMDAVDPLVVEQAEAVLAVVPGVSSVRRLRMRWVGHELRADVELDIPETTSLAQTHLLAHDAENTSHPRGRRGTEETWAVGSADPGR